MKRILFFPLLFVFLFQGSDVFAQDQPNEFYLGYGPGLISMQTLYETTNDLLDGIFSGESTNQNSTSIGIFSIGYNRFVSEKIKLGLNASYSSINSSLEYYDNSGNLDKEVKWTDDFLTFMVRADFHYMKKENLSMYSGLALGASFISSKEGSGAEGLSIPNATLFAFQVNAFGIRVGKGFGFFAETGFGYLGLINAGFNVRF
jgi:hypothetical protein